MKKDSRIFIAGHNGLVGSSILLKLMDDEYTNLITLPRNFLDLTDTQQVNKFFREYEPEYVFLAAAKVGGILANSRYKGDFIYQNLMIQTNVIDAAFRHNTKKLLFLGSSCIYPKHSKIPIEESELLTGPLEPTNDAYAIAKIAGIKMCQAYREQHGFNAIALMPTNLYGPGDNFDPENSHVLPGLLRRFHEAKEKGADTVMCWGDGSPLREFLYIEDLADACVFLMKEYDSGDIINVGTGTDVTIKALTEMIAETVGFKGTIQWDITKPNGTHRKVLNTNKITELGWNPKIPLEEGIKITYDWYKQRESLQRNMRI
jgi:GDP-L-fucose synthase